MLFFIGEVYLKYTFMHVIFYCEIYLKSILKVYFYGHVQKYEAVFWPIVNIQSTCYKVIICGILLGDIETI